MQPGKASSTSGLAPALAGLAIVAVLLACNLDGAPGRLAEARYLPTRSDPSETEALKSIIRNLLLETAPRLHANRFQPQLPEVTLPSQLIHLQRRAAEMSVSSSNGDEFDGYATGPLADQNAQLFRQANPKADRR